MKRWFQSKKSLCFALIGLVISFYVLQNCDGWWDKSEVEEKVPKFLPITSAPNLQPYVLEFSQGASKHIEETIPVGTNLIEGTVDGVDHNTNCSLWLILSHKGRTWGEDQKLYLYSDKSNQLHEVKAFPRTRVQKAFVFSDKQGRNPFILASVRQLNSDWWVSALWTNNLQTGLSARITTGGNWPDIAPDHSAVAFWRGDDAGFHSLHVWDANDGHIEAVLSMWESDPGSGTSWDIIWSKDSKALNIKGTCSGFYKNWRRGHIEFNLVYLVKERQMFSIEK